MQLIKPSHLNKGDAIATVSPCWGCAGDSDTIWRYDLGKKRLEELYDLKVIPAPNSMKGEKFLSANPKARAEDIIWAFENKSIKAIIANIGGNDSIKVVPFIDTKVISNNPKIFIGYSDVLFLHLLCYKASLSSFYGHNLLPVIAEPQGFHPYSQKWFEKVLFDPAPIGIIPPSQDWTCDENDYTNKYLIKEYHANKGYKLIQGCGTVQGKLIGGHTGLRDSEGTSIELNADDFKDKILFIEDITSYISPEHYGEFFGWLGTIGALEALKGIIVGKFTTYDNTGDYIKSMLSVINEQYGLNNLPILAELNFGHTSPICILPYGASAEIDCSTVQFSILDSGVV